MLHPGEVTRRLFILMVCAVAVVPRQHIDASRWTIGGSTISHSFRKLLLASAALNLLRLFVKLIEIRWLSDILGIIQIVSLTFLCFLTPYILQTWLASRINLGGRPGADLMPFLYSTALFSISGVSLARYVHPNLWFINRLGKVLTGPPVLKTLRTYNSVTTFGGNHAGRGNILCQTLVIIEWWHMLTQLLCAVGFALLDPTKDAMEYTLFDTALQGFRDIAFASGWTRVLAHAIFINLLEEVYLTTSSSTGDAESPSHADVQTAGTAVSEMPLVPQRKS